MALLKDGDARPLLRLVGGSTWCPQANGAILAARCEHRARRRPRHVPYASLRVPDQGDASLVPRRHNFRSTPRRDRGVSVTQFDARVCCARCVFSLVRQCSTRPTEGRARVRRVERSRWPAPPPPCLPYLRLGPIMRLLLAVVPVCWAFSTLSPACSRAPAPRPLYAEHPCRTGRLALSVEPPPVMDDVADKAARVLILPDAAGATDVAPPLPQLDESEEQRLRAGKRLRWQKPPGAGGYGSGFAVQELRADADEVWQAVSAFGDYPELISTVRTATAYDAGADAAAPAGGQRYSFLVSRIRLRLDVRFTVDEAQRYAAWILDRPSWVLNDSTGYWRVVPCEDRPGYVRVWFCVSVRLTRRVPGLVISLVSRLGLDKATRWLKDLEQPPEDGPPPV